VEGDGLVTSCLPLASLSLPKPNPNAILTRVALRRASRGRMGGTRGTLGLGLDDDDHEGDGEEGGEMRGGDARLDAEDGEVASPQSSRSPTGGARATTEGRDRS